MVRFTTHLNGGNHNRISHLLSRFPAGALFPTADFLPAVTEPLLHSLAGGPVITAPRQVFRQAIHVGHTFLEAVGILVIPAIAG